MTSEPRPALVRLLAIVPFRLKATLGLLTVLTALGEGFGFALIVPLLTLLSGDTDASGWTAALIRLPTGVLLAGFVLVMIVRALAETWRAVAAHAFAARIVDTLRMKVLSRLLHAEWSHLSGENLPRHQAVLLTDIERIGYAGDMFAQGVRAACLLTSLGIAGLLIAPQAAIPVVFLGLVVAGVHALLSRGAARSGERVTRSYEQLTLLVQQNLDNLRLVKTAQRERPVLRQTEHEVAALRAGEKAYVMGSAIARGVLTVLAAVLLAGAIGWFAGREVSPNWPVWIVVVALGVRAVPLLVALQQAAQQWAHERPALTNVEQTLVALDKVQEPVPTSKVSAAPRLRSMLELRDICVAHDGRTILDGVTLSVKAHTIAVVEGRSGVGKTTLADVVGGLIAPDTGALMLDGTEVRGAARAAWRAKVGYVDQRPALFSGTIREALTWGDADVSEDALQRALSQANAQFVHRRPGGLDAEIAFGAHRLSGGERQRLALARTLLRRPDLLILDEATSAVDPESEAAIAQSLRNLSQECTVLIIAHRGALTRLADRRFTLADGRVTPS